MITIDITPLVDQIASLKYEMHQANKLRVTHLARFEALNAQLAQIIDHLNPQSHDYRDHPDPAPILNHFHPAR